ncbi:TetR/AcrR family transcriptional regulator [Deinococcus planocerae]|uniref:TetR/AcrR family transcriptional regulator n=1 Tax=Deinococcus planocerae TaxID=1737569 RepID=UPI001C64159C|nr:TetR/AcrR family transcriptional regulator [Deinococcus planocerae]
MRETILDRAGELLAGRGYAGMSMDDVARAAGVTKGTLYHHFPEGKDALILAVGERSLRRHGDGLAAAITAAEGARAGLEAVARWTLEHSGGPEHILRDAVRFLPQEHAEAMTRGFMTRLYGPVRDLLEGGVQRGELPPHDTEFVAWAFLGLLAEFAELQPSVVRPRLAEQIVGLVLDGIGGK